jgi:hypothetical protein
MKIVLVEIPYWVGKHPVVILQCIANIAQQFSPTLSHTMEGEFPTYVQTVRYTNVLG